MEQFANNCSTTVAAGGYSVGSGVLNVESTAAPWPQIGDFRISVFNKSTKALKVILKVTAINGATQFAVTAEGTDAAAEEGDLVYGTMITAAGIANYVGFAFIEEKIANDSASLDFLNLPTTFPEFEFCIRNILPASNGPTFHMRFSLDGGANWSSTTSEYYTLGHYATASYHGVDQVTGESGILLHYGVSSTASYGGCKGSIRVMALTSIVANAKTVLGSVLAVQTNVGPNWHVQDIRGIINKTSAVNGLQFRFSTGNITSGSIALYGIR
jgi:hypothetical protein